MYNNGSFMLLVSIVGAILGHLTAQVAANPADAGIELLKGYAYNCVGKDGIEKGDVDALIETFNGGMDVNAGFDVEAYKCFFACMAEQFGIINNGAFQPKVAIAMSKAALQDPSKDEIIEKIIGSCEDISTQDKCMIGINLMMCFKEAATEHGVDLGKLFNL